MKQSVNGTMSEVDARTADTFRAFSRAQRQRFARSSE